MSLFRTALLAGIAAMAVTAAQAAPVTSNPTITSGGITFDSFTIQVTTAGQTSFPTAGNQVNVTAMNPGTGIVINSGFTSLGGGFSDAAISYVATGTAGVTSVGLSFDGSFFGLAIASVTETIYSDAARTNEIGFGYVSCGVIAGCTRSVSIDLSGFYDTLYITKDINVTSGATGQAQISFVNQSFNTTTPVPEPMSLALFGTGLVGLGLVRRARKA